MADRKTVFLLFLILLGQAALHAWLINKYVFTDEGSYLAMAKMVSLGEVLFRDIADYHAPGMEFAGALAFRVLGTSFETARILVAAVQMCTTLVLFAVGRRLFGVNAALAGAAIYAAVEPLSGGVWFVAEPFLTLFSLASFLVLIEARGEKRVAERCALLFACGILAGIACVFKQPAGALLPLYLGVIVWDAWRGGSGIKEAMMQGAAAIGGWVLPWILVAAYFAVNGAFPEMIYGLLVFPIFVKGSRDAGFFLESEYGLLFLEAAILVTGIVLVRTVQQAFAKPDKTFERDALLLAFMFAASATAIPRFNVFHLMAAIPVVSLFAGDMVARRLPPRPGWWRDAQAVGETVVANAMLFLALLPLFLILLMPNFVQPYDRGQELARYADGPTLSVPFDNLVYFYGNGTHASSFLMVDPVWMTPGIDAQVWRELRAKNGTVVYAAQTVNGKCLPEFMPELTAGLRSEYEVAAVPFDDVFILRPKGNWVAFNASWWDACKSE